MAASTTPYSETTDEQRAITEMVRQFVENELLPVAARHDREDSFPEDVVNQMCELGLFGVPISEEYGGMGLELATCAMIVEELSRGWISVSGILNAHFLGAYLLLTFGTEEQRRELLPRLASGEVRAAVALAEPETGSDLEGIRAAARQLASGDWELNGRKAWVTNGRRAGLVFVLAKTDPQADPPLEGMTCFIAEKEPGAQEIPGLTLTPPIERMGCRGAEPTELAYDGYVCPADRILGGEDGLCAGFGQVMDALELGRVNVAARGVGIARRALELTLRYAQERTTAGRPISEQQAVRCKLAEMATRVEAARLLTMQAARSIDAGERSGLEAGMAELYACEAGKEVVEAAFSIHRGYGHSEEYEVERLYRDALLLIGEGTSEIQRMVIANKLLQRHKI